MPARSPSCSPTTGGAGQLSRLLRAGAGEAPGVLHPCSQVRSPTRPLCDFVGAGKCNCTRRCMLRSLVEVTSPSEQPVIVSWRAVRSQRGREARHGHGLSLRRLCARDGEEVRLRRLPPPLHLPSLTPARRLLQTRTRRALASRTRHHPPSAHALSATHPTALRHAHAIVKDIANNALKECPRCARRGAGGVHRSVRQGERTQPREVRRGRPRGTRITHASHQSLRHASCFAQ